MKYIISLFTIFLIGCSSFRKETQNIGIIYDYILNTAQSNCHEHGGLHYIVAVKTLYNTNKKDDYPCLDIYKVRCQDQSMIEIDSGIRYCDVSQIQIKESLK